MDLLQSGMRDLFGRQHKSIISSLHSSNAVKLLPWQMDHPHPELYDWNREIREAANRE